MKWRTCAKAWNYCIQNKEKIQLENGDFVVVFKRKWVDTIGIEMEIKMKQKKHIFLIGFMGVGKTSTSRELSKKLNVKEVDTDAMIVEQQGRSISKIFEESGEPYFRTVETGTLDILADTAPCIVSCGGGMAMREENVRKMKEVGTVIFLTATAETIYSHVKDSTDRPLLNGNMNIPYIQQLMEAREPKYKAAADICIKTDGCTPAEVADKILDQLA